MIAFASTNDENMRNQIKFMERSHRVFDDRILLWTARGDVLGAQCVTAKKLGVVL